MINESAEERHLSNQKGRKSEQVKKKRITKRLLSLLLAVSMMLPGMPFEDMTGGQAFASENIQWSADNENQAGSPEAEVASGEEVLPKETQSDFAPGVTSEESKLYIDPEDQEKLLKGVNGVPGIGKSGKVDDGTNSRFVDEEDDENLRETIEDTRPAEDQIVDFMVVLDKAPMLDKFTPDEIRKMSDEVKAYSAELEQLVESVEEQLSASFGSEEGFKFGYSHTIATAAVAVKTRYGNRAAIEAMEGVERVYVAPAFGVAARETSPVQPLTSNAPNMIGATELNDSGYTGKGMKVGIIDTGIVVDHPNFQEMADDKLTDESLTEEEVVTVWDQLNASENKSLRKELAYRSNKLPFIFNYYGRDFDVGHHTANHDHGTHVAGIAAGNKVEGSETVGVAPDAQILVFQVFNPSGGAEWSTIIAALEDCVLLGADTANLSLGSPSGFTDGDKEMREVLARFENTDTNVLIAAGNDTNNAYMNLLGTDMSKSKFVDNGLIGTPATVPAAISVASADNDGAVLPYFEVDGFKIGFTDTATSSETGFLSQFNNTEKEFVIVPGVGDVGDYTNINVAGKIAVVSRGETSFQDKQKVAKDKGAIGLIVYNNVGGTFAMQISDGAGHIPAVSITQADGEKLIVAAGRMSPPILRVCNFGETIKVNVERTMSSFSSWGATPDLKIKPEITGVGGNILAPRDPQFAGSNYGNMSGTSMATPQVAGAFAVLQQYLKAEKNLQGKELRTITTNLAMSTANQLEEGGSLYSVRNQGAGLVDLKKATTARAYFTAPGSFEGRPKGEMGDNSEGVFSFEFELNSLFEVANMYGFEAFVMTADIDESGEYMTNTTRRLEAEVVIKHGNDIIEDVYLMAGNKIALTAEITLTENDKKFIEENFPYGNYVEGYLYAVPKVSDGVKVSMPFLGFYGDWSDSPVFDDEGEDAQLQAPIIKTARGKIGQNPFIMGGKAGDKYNAISLGNPLEKMTFGLMRNVRRIHQRVTSKDGNTEYFSWGEDYMIKTYYNASYGIIMPYEIIHAPDYNIYIWEGTDKNGNRLPDGTQVTYTFSTYLDDGDDKVDDVYSFDLTVDTQAPVIENKESLETSIIKDQEKGTVTLPLTIKDNHYIAAVMFEDIDGNILGKYEVNNEPGETLNLEFDVTGYGTDFKVIVGDYAANETTVDLSLDLSDMPIVYPDPIALDKGRIYGYETYTDGYVNMGWFSANKEDFSNLRNETYSEYGNVISSAEYINGYVVGQRYNDGALIVFTPYESYWNQSVIWEQTGKGTTTENPGAIIFYDMAMDYSTNTLYASGWEYKGDMDGNGLDDGHNALFKITLGDTVEVTEVAPIQDMTNSINALTLACTTEGQLYIINSNGVLYKLDKNNGTITEVGTTSFVNEPNYAGVNVIQSMAYDHNTGDTYWYAHSQALLGGSYVNVGAVYKVDLDTAELTYIGGSGNSGYTSLFIPSDEIAENVEFRVDPTGLEITPGHIKIVKGQSRRMSVKWQPWNALPVAIRWSTQDPEIATVNTNGKVTAVGTGVTKLQATVEINGQEKTFESTIEVLQSAEELYGFVIVDYNGKVPESSWITYADSKMSDITKISGPGGLIQGGTYYEGNIYYVEAEQIPFAPANTKVYKAKVEKGTTGKETKIVNQELIYTLEGIELGNLGFDYNTGRMYAVDYSRGGLVLLDIDSGEVDFLGEFKGDIGGPVIMPAMCVTANGNIIGSDMYGRIYQVNPDTMQTRLLANAGVDSWFYAAMTYDYNTGNIYWNPCMEEGMSDLYMISFTDTKDGNVLDVELINLGGVGGDKGAEQTVIFTIPNDEPETTYINAQSVTITNGEEIIYVQGGTMQMNTVTNPVRPTVKPRKWYSDNESVATVTNRGLVSFVGEGTATIKVVVENKGENPSPASVEDTIKVTVYENAGEFMAFLGYDEGATNYFDFWVTMKDYEIQKTKTTHSMIGSYSLRAGDYYDGYIYAFNDKEEFYKINADNPVDFTVMQNEKRDGDKRVINMAIDNGEGIMYGVTLDKKLVTIDLNTGKVEEVAPLDKRIDAIAFDDLGNLYGVGSEEIYKTSYLYVINKTSGKTTEIQELSTEGGVVYTAENYYSQRMYSPQMAYDYGTNRLYLNATIRHRTFASSNKGFIMIQLSDHEEEVVPEDSEDVSDNSTSDNSTSDNSTSDNSASDNSTSNNSASNNSAGTNNSKVTTKEAYRGRTSFTSRIFDAVKKFFNVGTSSEEAVEDTESEGTEGIKCKQVEFMSNLGKPGLEILSAGKELGDVYLGLLVSIPEEGEIKANKVTGIRLNRENARVEVGEKTTIKAEIVPTELSEDVDKSVTWTSSDDKIATVDPVTGEVTGIKPGTVTITATSKNNGKAKASSIVEVLEKRGEQVSRAYTVSAKKDKLVSFDPEVPGKAVEEITTMYGGGYIAGITRKDENTLYYVVANYNESSFPVLYTYDMRSKSSQRIAMLDTHGPDASDIAYDSKNDLLYVVNGYYVFQFVAKNITTGTDIAGFSQRLFMAQRQDVFGEYILHGVTVKDEDVYFVGSDNTSVLFKTDDKFTRVEKIGNIGVNTVRDKCEIEYDKSVDRFYITDASDKLYTFDVNGTEESKIQNLKTIDILADGLDINGLCIIPAESNINE